MAVSTDVNNLIYADVLKQLHEYQYTSIDAETLKNSIETGLSNRNFTNLVAWLCHELSVLYGLDVTVNELTDEKDLEIFLMELSLLLNELECPIEDLVRGPVDDRLLTVKNRQELVIFLLSHMQSARLTALTRLKNIPKTHKTLEVEFLENALKSLKSGPPPENLTIHQLFDKLKSLIESQLSTLEEPPKPLMVATLSDSQWAQVEAINKLFVQEYHARISLLIKRLDVTIQSFFWSDRIKRIRDNVMAVYRPLRDAINTSSVIHIHDLLAADTSLLLIDKASDVKIRQRTATPLNKILIGKQPADRGGRPSELRVPPPEMPSWKKERTVENSRGGGRGSRGDANHGNRRFENQVMREYQSRNYQNYEQNDYQQSHGRSRGGRGGRGGRRNFRGGDSGSRGHGRY